MRFQDAVEQAAQPVDKAYAVGKQALENKHRNLIKCEDERRMTGSINLDAALAKRPEYASEPRWDYGLGYQAEKRPECAIWVEVHAATTYQVGAVVKKLDWLKKWLQSNEVELRRLTESADAENRYIWIATNGVHIPRNSREFRILNMKGIHKVCKFLHLP